jgi:alcohol dehydrogenase class IV
MKQLIIIDNEKPNYLSEYLLNNAINSVFLVHGRDSYYQSGSMDYIKNLDEKIEFHHFFNFSTNPKIEDVIIGNKEFIDSKAQIIIAIGGGSVIDMAKLIRINYPKNQPVEDFLLTNPSFQSNIDLIAIPTTAGTGSESTHFSVMYIGKKKYSIASKSMLPNTVLLNAKLTYSTSAKLTAITGMDALSQAIESYWSTNSTLASINYSRSAIKRILKYLPIAVNEINNEEARKNLLLAANEAGKAINITKTTAPHAISYSFTSHFNIPHGHAVAITLPLFLLYNYHVSESECNDTRGFKHVQQSILEIALLFGVNKPTEAEKYLRNFINKIGIEIDLVKLGINQKLFNSKILPNINVERLSNNPRKLTNDWYKTLF